MMTLIRLTTLSLMLALLGAPPALAQAWPSKAITFIVPFPPGGGTDVTARIIAKQLAEQVGQSVVVDNRPGAGGVAGALAAKAAAPDGHTLFIGHVGSAAIDVHLRSKLEYDPVNDFRPVTTFMSFLSFLVVPADSPAKNVKDLLQLARTKPGGLSFASQGQGTAGHFLGEMLRSATDVPMVHIPMKGGAPAVAETVAGRTDLLFASYISSRAFLRDGKLRALAYAGNARSPVLPEVPTLLELGIKGVEFDQWFAFFLPAKTPDTLLRRVNEELVKAIRHPDVVKAISSQAADIVTGSPEDLARLIAADTARYGAIVKRIGAKAD